MSRVWCVWGRSKDIAVGRRGVEWSEKKGH
jgi:hypothetical protein